MKQQKGFTLIEILVVTTILAVLAVGAFVSFASAGKSARDSRRKTDLETVRQAMVLYKAETGCYPSGDYGTAVGALVTGGYLSSPAPSDPKPSTHSYVYAPGGVCTGGAAIFTLSVNPTLEGGSTYEVRNP